MNYAYVTLFGTNDFFPNILALSISFKTANSKYPLIILVNETIDQKNILYLQNNNLGIIKQIPNWLYHNDYYNHYPVEEKIKHYQCTRQKFEAFNLTEYDKLCLLDADVVFYKNENFDDIFDEKYDFIFYDKGILYENEKELHQLASETYFLTPNKELYLQLISDTFFSWNEQSVLNKHFLPLISSGIYKIMPNIIKNENDNEYEQLYYEKIIVHNDIKESIRVEKISDIFDYVKKVNENLFYSKKDPALTKEESIQKNPYLNEYLTNKKDII